MNDGLFIDKKKYRYIKNIVNALLRDRVRDNSQNLCFMNSLKIINQTTHTQFILMTLLVVCCYTQTQLITSDIFGAR
jgi:hypothetical protein